jgi:hypothetical protein
LNTDNLPGPRTGVDGIGDDDFPIDDDTLNPFGILMRVGIGAFVEYMICIKNCDIGKISLLLQAVLVQFQPLRRQAGHLPDGFLE